jgi:hypothetical protein
VSYEVNWEIRALDLAAGFLGDDPAGVAELWESVSRLAEEPRPPEFESLQAHPELGKRDDFRTAAVGPWPRQPVGPPLLTS